MDFGIASYAGIVVLCYLVGLGCKASSKLKQNEIIPVIVGAVGAGLGMIAFALKIPDFPAADFMNAAAVGVVSGLTATGVNQITKISARRQERINDELNSL